MQRADRRRATCTSRSRRSIRVAKGKEEFYAYDEKERDEIMERLGNGEGRGSVNVQRYKGLGEMNPTQLWNDDDGSRAAHAAAGDHGRRRAWPNDVFQTLMGDEVEPRRAFIEANAKFVSNLDI